MPLEAGEALCGEKIEELGWENIKRIRHGLTPR